MSYTADGPDSPPPRYRHAEVITWLVKHGAPVDNQDIVGLTALHHAGSNNRIAEVTKALLESGANPNCPDKAGSTPLQQALYHSQAEAVEMMLDFGGDMTIGNEQNRPGIVFIKTAPPHVQAVVQKWIRKRSGTQAPLEDRNKCFICPKPGKHQCARCHVVRYCSSACQSTSEFFLRGYSANSF